MTGYPQAGGYQYPPATYQPPPPVKLRPGRIWYLVSLVIFAAATAWLIYGIFAFVGKVDGLQRVQLPAGGAVHLAHTGGYVVYYEGPGAQNGHIPSFTVHVTPGSPEASLRRYGASLTYNVGSRHGRAVLTLTVARPGTFAVNVTGTPAAGSDLAFGASIARGIVGIVVPAVPLMIVAFLGGLAVFIIRLARKSSLRRALG